MRNNIAGCGGGAILVTADNLGGNRQQPYITNVTISNTTFINNDGGFGHDALKVWRDGGVGGVPCPAPGTPCDAPGGCCCIDGDHTDFSYVLPTA